MTIVINSAINSVINIVGLNKIELLIVIIFLC